MNSSRAPPSLPFLVLVPGIILLSAFFTVTSSSVGQLFPRSDLQTLLRSSGDISGISGLASFLPRNMSSEGGPAVGPRLHRLSTWFDPEIAAVVTILLGLFQVLLSVLLASAEQTLPKLFLLPLALGILIVAGGSFTMANERNPSRQLLRGCACSNVACLLGALLAFCLYCYSLSSIKSERCVSIPPSEDFYHYRISHYGCPNEVLAAYCWSITLLLLLYDSGAIVLHCLLSVSALKALKTE